MTGPVAGAAISLSPTPGEDAPICALTGEDMKPGGGLAPAVRIGEIEIDRPPSGG